MDASEVTEVCRLCPSSGDGQNLINVFNKELSFKYNLIEVILLTTGIEVQEHDLVSKQICQRCCKILLKMFEFRLDAIKQDRALKEKLSQYLKDKGIQFPNTCITIKKEYKLPIKVDKMEADEIKPSISKEDFKKRFHPSIIDIYKNYPHLKLPKRCFERHMAPIVSLTMNEVETYFKKRKLNMKNFIYKPDRQTKPSQEVAKKKTSFPANQMTVAPLKISKKLFGNYKPSTSADKANEFSVSVSKKHKPRQIVTSDSDTSVDSKLSRKSQSKKRKRALSSTDSDESEGLKLTHSSISQSQIKISLSLDADKESTLTKNNQPISLSVSEPLAQMPKLTANTSEQVQTPFPIIDVSTSACNTHEQVKTEFLIANISTKAFKESELVTTQSPSADDPLPEDNRISSPVLENPICEDSCSSNISEATTSSSLSKTEFIDFLGLTPTVTATKSHTLLVCSFCGSVHHNANELKTHTRRHMVCQFCKRRFKSVTAKQDHVDNLCQIKKIMNSPEPIVALEKIDLNMEVRKKYEQAFATLNLIPGLVEVEPSPLEHVVHEAAASPSANDDIIVLSDDDELPVKSTDPLSGVPTTLAGMPSPAAENIVYNTVSIVRPDIRIKNNTVLNNLVENLTDKHLLKDLIMIFRPQPTVIEKMIQTDLPATKNIKINNSEGTCEFKRLKEHMETYKIPITMSNGSFHVAYQFKNDTKEYKTMAQWNDLAVIDEGKKTIPNTSTSNKLLNSLLMANPSKSSLPPPNLKNLSVPAAPDGTTTFAITPTSAVTNSSNLTSVNISNSATPLLQNYALRVTPATVINKPIPIPRTYINSALSNTVITSNKGLSSANGNNIVSNPPVLVESSYSGPQSVPTLNVNRICNTSSTTTHPTNLCIPAASQQPLTNTSVRNIYSPLSTSSNLLSNSLSNPPVSQQQLANTSLTNIKPYASKSNLVTNPLSNPAFSQQQLTNVPSTKISPVSTTGTSITNSLGTSSQQPIAVTPLTNISSVLTTGSFVTSQATPNPSTSTSERTSSIPEPVRFRVKNVWELQ